jgi:hypothetical protein
LNACGYLNNPAQANTPAVRVEAFIGILEAGDIRAALDPS